MKQLITILSILFISSGLVAQDNSRFQAAMTTGLAKMASAKTDGDYQATANMFNRIATNEKEEWSPQYYYAFIKTFRAFEAKDKAAAAAELATIQPIIEATLELDALANNPGVKSEIHTLLAMMYSARMMEDPMKLGMRFGPLNAEQLQKAIALNKENPRAHLLQAQTLFYTPEAFGGDKAKAKELAELSIKYFEAESESEPKDFMPRWGKEQVDGLLKQMK